MKWVQGEMEKAFLCKVEGILGEGEGYLKEARVLGRIIRWTPSGFLYEGDPRHAEYLLRDLGLADTPSLSSPSIRMPAKEGEGAQLSDSAVTQYRKCAARLNYLALDRPDLAYSAKELCRRMSAPDNQDWDALCRAVRYLAGAPRMVYHYPWQARAPLTVFVDTDFAGCLETRRSTNGGCGLFGVHLIKHWSTTQKIIALSSGEAELGGVVRGMSEAIGLQSLARDLGEDMELEVCTDASAAIGMCQRTGIGKVRHLAVGQLWVQSKVRDGEIRLYKVKGAENMDGLGVLPQTGRANSAPAIK